MNSGQVIRKIIADKGITCVWLAKQLNMKYSTLNMALGKDLPYSTILNICAKIQITVNEFARIYDELNIKKDTEHPAKNDSVSKTNNDT